MKGEASTESNLLNLLGPCGLLQTSVSAHSPRTVIIWSNTITSIAPLILPGAHSFVPSISTCLDLLLLCRHSCIRIKWREH